MERSKAPESAEILDLAETRALYQSNLFRMQTAEMVAAVTPAESAEVDKFLFGLKKQLTVLKAREIGPDFNAAFPGVDFRLRQPYPFEFKPPAKLDVVGSYIIKSAAKPMLNVDVVVDIPQETLQSKDHLHGRYLDKRAAYVAEMHRQLTEGTMKGMESSSAVSLGLFQGDRRKPALLFSPEGAASFTVRVLPVYPPGFFAAAKLAPTRNCLRRTEGDVVPTPHYNMSVLEDGLFREHARLLDRACDKWTAFKDVVRMLKVWAHQRGFCRAAKPGKKTQLTSDVNGFLLSMIAAHLCLAQTLAATTSSNQLFKLIMNWLANTDFKESKIILGNPMPQVLTAEEKRLFRAHFYDADGLFNLAWRAGDLSELRHEAAKTTKCLDTESGFHGDVFDAVFGVRHRQELKWDVTVIVTPNAARDEEVCKDKPKFAAEAECHDAACVGTQVGDRLAKLLKEGLGDRCKRTVLRKVDGDKVAVGVVLDPANLGRTVDRGPAADSPDAARWRSLWGPKSELRRFKDGSILECVAWKEPAARKLLQNDGADSIPAQVVHFLVGHHFPSLAETTVINAHPLGCASAQFDDFQKALWPSFDEMSGHVKSLSGLPLTVKDILPRAEAFSYTEVEHELKTDAKGLKRRVLDVVVEFESSGNWPKDLDAVAKVKTAFLLKIQSEITTDLGIETEITEDFLDLLYPQHVYRLRIVNQEEMVDAAAEATAVEAVHKKRPEIEGNLATMKSLWWKPSTRAAMRRLALLYPAFAPGVRLAKQWMQAHLLGDDLDDFVEHLMAAVFLSPEPFEAPTSAHVALGRFFFLLSSGHDWTKAPLLIDLGEEWTAKEREEMQGCYERGSKQSTAPAFWIASKFDPHALFLNCPPRAVCRMLVGLAKGALEVFSQRLLADDTDLDKWRPLFTADLTVFDVVIHLGSAKKSGAVGSLDEEVWPLVHEYVAKLRHLYGPVALFFLSLSRGVIAVKWRPVAMMPQQKRQMMTSVPHLILGKKQTVCPNALYILGSFKNMGQGLVTKVEVQ